MAALLFLLVLVSVGVGRTILWVWTLVDCATKEPSRTKLVCLGLLLAAGCVPSLQPLYTDNGHPARNGR